MKKLLYYSIIIQCLFFLSTYSWGQNTTVPIKAKDLIELSFQELMNVQIKTATLTGLERSKTPATLTIISRKDIESTPARNLLDLLEVYVPGGTYVNHWLGPRMGIRGIMSDQNNSFLLIVNGEQMNLRYNNGPFFEILNKDLSDIEKIEIISGPGSVTYGPGAIGGVISITTVSAKNADKANIGMQHDFTYRYSNINAQYSHKNKSFSASIYGAIGKSDGIKDPQLYYIDRAHGYGYGYMSDTWGNKGIGSPAPNFYADFDNRPEAKVQLDINFLKEFRFIARYTSFSFIKQAQQAKSLEGPAFSGYDGQQFTSSLRNDHHFNKEFQIETKIGFQSQSIGDIQLYQGEQKPFHDITQRNGSYSENRINFQSLLNYQPNKKLKLALGIAYNYWYYGPEWGKSKDSFVMDFAPPIKFAIIDANSGFYLQYNDNGIVTLIEAPIDAHQASGFFEFNYQAFDKTTILLSGRIDKHNLAKTAISPRLAIIQEINENNFVKFIAQQSVRLPNFRELYSIGYTNDEYPNPEKIRRLELIYTSLLLQNLSMSFSSFYQSLHQIAWTENEKSELIGNFNTAGFIVDLSYKKKKLSLRFNYSFTKQLNWYPEFELHAYLSNIGVDSLDIPLQDAGNNRINNFPQHQIKLITSYQFNSSFSAHFNARFASEYGQLDMLNMFRDIHYHYGDTPTQTEMNNIYNDVRDKGYAKPSFTSNLSVSYHFDISKTNFTFTAYVMNLFSVNHIRYVFQYWEDGNNRQYPRQVGFINEPPSFGFRLNAKF